MKFHYTDPVNADSIYRNGLLAHPMGEKHGENWLRDGFGIVVEQPVVWLTSNSTCSSVGTGGRLPTLQVVLDMKPKDRRFVRVYDLIKRARPEMLDFFLGMTKGDPFARHYDQRQEFFFAGNIPRSRIKNFIEMNYQIIVNVEGDRKMTLDEYEAKYCDPAADRKPALSRALNKSAPEQRPDRGGDVAEAAE